MKSRAIFSISFIKGLCGDGNDCRMCIILESIKLLKIVTLPIGDIFLHDQVHINFFMDSIFNEMLCSVILFKFKTSYSIPSTVNEFTHSKLFSPQKRRSVSRIGPILITLVLCMFIFKPDS